ncbi:MAG: alkaline phosphatase [Planctomycetaceae bacterium]
MHVVVRRRVPLPAACLAVAAMGCAAAAAAPDDLHVATPDRIRAMQAEAEAAGRTTWGYWGDQPGRYVSHSSHSNRLIPVYTFGITLDAVSGTASVYRDAARLEALYGRLPEQTLEPAAEYFDQTDVYRLQLAAADAGKKVIVLVVFDGMDWHTTRLAAIATRGTVEYAAGRGTGFSFQDYRGPPTDFGFCVTSPANDKTLVDVDAQIVRNPGGEVPGGYDPARGGFTPWDRRASLTYLIGKDREMPHAYTDSAASATSLCAGIKTYNDSINVDVEGTPVEPIARTLQRRGYAVGVVSSVPPSHATPACTYATNVSRDDYQDIARDLVGLPSIAHRGEPLPGLDVVIGGGFGVAADPEKDKDQGANLELGPKYVAGSTLAAIDAAHGGRYRMALRTPGRRGADVLAEAAAAALAGHLRLFGLFGAAEGHLPFCTANGDYDPAAGTLPTDDPKVEKLRLKYGSSIRYTEADLLENPTLDEMATTALDVLSARGPFWLLVEAGDVDWASHANNVDNAIGAVRSGDAAVRAVLEWIERRGIWADAAVIVTSDHGHAFVLTAPEAFAGGR